MEDGTWDRLLCLPFLFSFSLLLPILYLVFFPKGIGSPCCRQVFGSAGSFNYFSCLTWQPSPSTSVHICAALLSNVLLCLNLPAKLFGDMDMACMPVINLI